jgi:hypothetical protein
MKGVRGSQCISSGGVIQMSDRRDYDSDAGQGPDRTDRGPAHEANDTAPAPGEGSLPTTPPPADGEPIDGVDEIEIRGPAHEANDTAPAPGEGSLPTTPPPADSEPIDGVDEIEISLKQNRLRLIGLSTKSNIYIAAMAATTIELTLPNPDWLKASGLAVTALFAVLAARRRRD